MGLLWYEAVVEMKAVRPGQKIQTPPVCPVYKGTALKPKTD